MMSSILQTAVLAGIILCWKNPVQAFPDGAGGCAGGMPAVGIPHLTAAVVRNGTLSMLNMSATIDGGALKPNQIFSITAGVDHLIRVLSPSRNLRGVLMRVEAPEGIDTSLAILPLERTKVAAVCVAPVAGITHFKDNDKLDASGILRFDQEIDTFTIDITTVRINNADLSEYAYNRFTGRVIAGPPTSQPDTIIPVPSTNVPSAAPIATSSPITRSPLSPAPFTSPIPSREAPALFPPTPDSESPSDVPSDTPSDVPSNVPSFGPSPAMVPSQLPSALSSPAPTGSNRTMAPSMPPILAMPSVTPAPSAPNSTCSSEGRALRSCFLIDLGSAAQTCDSCVASSVPSSVRDCAELSQVMCAAISVTCSCGACQDEVISFLNCVFREANTCTIECSSDNGNSV